MIRISQIDDKFSIYKENTVVLLGIGAGTKQMIDLLKYHGIEIAYICDSNQQNFGKVLDGIPVISPAHLQELVNKSSKGVMVQISINNIAKDTEDKLFAIGVKTVVSFVEAWNIFNYQIKSNIIKDNLSIKEDYEEYRKSRPILERYKANEYVMNNYFLDQLLFVCMPPKTGDNTLTSTFRKHKIPHHFTMHTPEAINREFLLNLNKKVKITFAVRDPLSASLSGLYENLSLPYFTNVICNYNLHDLDTPFFENNGDAQEIFNNQFNSINSKNHFEMFIERFSKNIIDLTKYEFDKDKGYTIIKDSNIEIFVYQLEKMNDIVNEMSDWLGKTPFSEWTRSNSASDKWVAKSYKQAQKEIIISKEFFDKCYNHELTTHFYSNLDIAKFKAKWESQIEG